MCARNHSGYLPAYACLEMGAPSRHAHACMYVNAACMYVHASKTCAILRVSHSLVHCRCPDIAKVKPKMIFASSKDNLKKRLVGIACEVQGSDRGDVEFDEVGSSVSYHSGRLVEEPSSSISMSPRTGAYSNLFCSV